MLSSSLSELSKTVRTVGERRRSPWTWCESIIVCWRWEATWWVVMSVVLSGILMLTLNLILGERACRHLEEVRFSFSREDNHWISDTHSTTWHCSFLVGECFCDWHTTSLPDHILFAFFLPRTRVQHVLLYCRDDRSWVQPIQIMKNGSNEAMVCGWRLAELLTCSFDMQPWWQK